MNDSGTAWSCGPQRVCEAGWLSGRGNATGPRVLYFFYTPHPGAPLGNRTLRLTIRADEYLDYPVDGDLVVLGGATLDHAVLPEIANASASRALVLTATGTGTTDLGPYVKVRADGVDPDRGVRWSALVPGTLGALGAACALEGGWWDCRLEGLTFGPAPVVFSVHVIPAVTDWRRVLLEYGADYVVPVTLEVALRVRGYFTDARFAQQSDHVTVHYPVWLRASFGTNAVSAANLQVPPPPC